ncbi:sensor histidine kinase [Fulvivirga aurantia]|uniref:sensor histidine kinase n=1 Tax=Fulvivirga aurantia TaxID=2529383 RepID=UPI001FE2799F|nr:ATP-binding protein [Fulvivirga aurantia]
MAKFILAIKHSDFSINFNKSKIGTSFDILNDSFEQIIQQYKQAKIEKEAQFQYLKTVVDHINIGIISIENSESITLINRTAEKLLNITGVNNWQIFKEKLPAFSLAVKELQPEGRRLLEIELSEKITLSLDVSTVILLEKEYTLVTFQDIRNEIEQKEIEAWHKLIRILTHEIMNSATPISSLTETMQMMLNKEHLSDDIIEDLKFSLKTIQRRSDGMLAFIDDYRKITRVPKPNKTDIDVKELFDGIARLTKSEIEKQGIDLKSESQEGIIINADTKLIEQIILNLIKNAQDALKSSQNKIIHLSAKAEEKNIVIKVKDTGSGIEDDLLKEIFIPFFSTKKEGSGIGLSLSKQIMHMHGGSIKAESIIGEGTTFTLRFSSAAK